MKSLSFSSRPAKRARAESDAILQKLAKESGFDGELADLSDDILIYHLKMRDSAKDAVIPGIQKDYEEDFKTALLRARGVIKE